MNFAFSVDQRSIADVARRFAAEQLAPFYSEREREGRIAPEVIRRMGELGLIGAELPAGYGGLGISGVSAG